MEKTFSPQLILYFDNNDDREKMAVQLFKEATENNNKEFLCQLAEFIIGEEVPTDMFSIRLQTHCLVWLCAHYSSLFTESEDDSPQEAQLLENFLNCLWKFKWFISRLPLDINYSLEEIKEFNMLMFAYYDSVDLSLSTVYKTLMEQNILLGNAEASQEYFHLWKTTESDEMQDCQACQLASQIDYYHFTGQYKKVIQEARPILSGQLTCTEVPQISYYPIIDSLIHLRQYQEASQILEQATQKIISEETSFLRCIPQLIQLHSRLSMHEKAMELLDRYAEDVENIGDNQPFVYLQYLIAIAFYNPDALKTAQQQAEIFDQRNGNDYYQIQIERLFSHNHSIH